MSTRRVCGDFLFARECICTLDPGHLGQHKGRTKIGHMMEWGDDTETSTGLDALGIESISVFGSPMTGLDGSLSIDGSKNGDDSEDE